MTNKRGQIYERNVRHDYLFLRRHFGSRSTVIPSPCGPDLSLETLQYENGDGDDKGLGRIRRLPSAFPPKVYITKKTSKLQAFVNLCVYLRGALCNFQLWTFGPEKIKFLKLSQMNGLDK